MRGLLQAFHRHGVPQIRWLELRDLFDLALAIEHEFAKRDGVIRCCLEYLRAGDTPLTQHKFARSLRERESLGAEFSGGLVPLLAPGRPLTSMEPSTAWEPRRPMAGPEVATAALHVASSAESTCTAYPTKHQRGHAPGFQVDAPAIYCRVSGGVAKAA